MALDLYKYVASVPDYPEKGIIFRDILPLMADGAAFKQATDELVDYAKDKKVDMVVGPEARGFIVGCPIARELGVGFAPARKKGKLPRKAISASYDLEYGSLRRCISRLSGPSPSKNGEIFPSSKLDSISNVISFSEMFSTIFFISKLSSPSYHVTTLQAL